MRAVFSPRPPRGFSLVELLVVIVIIAILMGLTLVGSRYAMVKGYSSKTALQLKLLESGLEKFHVDRLEYPNPSTGGSKVLYIALTGDGISFSGTGAPLYTGTPNGKIEDTENERWSVYVEELLAPGGKKSLQNWVDPKTGYRIVDGFGEEVQYRCDPANLGRQQNNSYDLWSYGTDTTSARSQPEKWLKNW